MDDDGYLFYQARNDDMIISAGYNIAGPEVEGALLQHEAVSECGVVGVADSDRGSVVKAFVVLKPGFSGDDAMVKRSEERRVGKECVSKCRSRWSPCHKKKKTIQSRSA